MGLEQQAIAGVKWGAVAKLSTQVVSWAVTLLVVRLLVPADYGLMALCGVVLTTLSGLAELGLGASLIQARTLTDHDLKRVAGALWLLNVACAAVIFLAAPLIATVFAQPRLDAVLRVSTVQLLLGAAAAVPEALAYRALRFRWLAAADITAGLATSAATLALALGGFGVWSLVLGTIGGAAVRTVLLVARSPLIRPTLELSGIGSLLRFGGAWSGARFAWQLTYQVDVLIAGRFLTQEAVGIYSVAMQLANLPLQKGMSIVNGVAFPAISRLQDDLPRMRRRLLDAIRVLSFGAVPALWGISAVAGEFVEVALGEDWEAVVPTLQAIALIAPLRMLATLLATALSAVGRADVELVNTLVSLAVAIVAFGLGVRWGLQGLTAAYVMAVGVSFALNFPRTVRIVQISARDIVNATRSTFLAGALMLVCVNAARAGLPIESHALRLMGLIGVGGVAYTATLLLLDRAIWRQMLTIVAALRERP
ncbi:MAG TPA: lipopolysaccharide biosynthesis protein [Gammaproteobacteria bacterium]|nr:lipopolysaccharide biosynthesis protein [Gammaproteobacteria bacterium]